MMLLGLASLLAVTLCIAVWRLAKAGGRVDVGFKVIVHWGQK